MARRKKKSGGGGGEGGGWIVTFSDLMTLLLTFFVLLLSMASMDSSKLIEISSFDSGYTIMSLGSQSKMSDRVKVITEMINNPQHLKENEERLKELIFPDELLPDEVTKEDLKDNLRILQHAEGVVIVLTGDLLFAEGSAVLDEKGKTLLGQLAPVIMGVNSDVNIGGFTDSMPGKVLSNDDLSALRAMAALECFLHEGLQPRRFSISAYGADKPMYSNDTEEGRARNRRVEVLLKTTNRLAGY